jgi:hypothetical protein
LQGTGATLLILALLIPSIAASSPLKAQDIPPGALTAGSPTNNEPKPLTEAEVVNLLKEGVPPSRVGEIARERKIDFQITAEAERKIRLAGGDGDLVRILRQLAAKGFGFLFVASEPPGARVTLDGDPIGVTPLTQENVKSGPHRLVVSSPSYHSRVLNVVVEPNVVTRSSVEFDQLLSVSVETDFDFGTLSVDNLPVGPVKPTQRLPLSAGVHTFRVQDSQMSVDISQEVDVGESDQRVLFLKADYLGNLTILSGIAIENLTVNGRSVDSPAVTVRDILAGSATVYGTSGPANHVSQNVNIVAGETAILRFGVADLNPNPPRDVSSVASPRPAPGIAATSPVAQDRAVSSVTSPPPTSTVAEDRGRGIVEVTGYSGAAFRLPGQAYIFVSPFASLFNRRQHPLAGGTIAVSLNRWLWIYWDTSYIPLGHIAAASDSISQWLLSGDGGLRLQFPWRSLVVPFVNAGVGPYYLGGSISSPGGNAFLFSQAPYRDISAQGGGGVRVRISQRWGIRTSLQYADFRHFSYQSPLIFDAGVSFETRPVPSRFHGVR